MCPNCSNNNHAADDTKCLMFQYRFKILETSRNLSIPYNDAKAMFNNPNFNIRSRQDSPPNHPSASSANRATNQTISALQLQVDSLQAQLVSLRESVQPLLPLSQMIESNNSKLDKVAEIVHELSKAFVPLIPSLTNLIPHIPKPS